MLLLDPTIVGTALSFTSVVNSAIEADVSRDAATTVTGGTQLASGYTQQTNDASLNILRPTDLTLGADIAGNRNVIVLAIQRLVATQETCFGSLGWRELL